MSSDRTITETSEAYRVVLVFHLKPGQADEELQRSSRGKLPQEVEAAAGLYQLGADQDCRR